MTDSKPVTKLKMTRASEITPRRQKWFWEPFQGQGVIPLGTATIVAGKGGEGKTTFMLDLAAKGSRGELPGDLYGQKIETIIIGPEDDWETAMVPRLKGAQANLDKIWQIGLETEYQGNSRERAIKFPLDVDFIEQAIHEYGAKMLIVDPAPSLMHGDMNKAQDVRSSYEPLIALAQKYEFALILINHFGKGGGSVSSKLSGSHAWRDLTRSYLAFAMDEESGERVFSQDKGNYTKNLNSYKFALDSVDVDFGNGETANVAKVNFMGLTTQTVDEIINRESFDEDGSARSEAAEWLLAFLDNDQKESARKIVMKAARGEGFSESTLKRAKKALNVQHSRTREAQPETIWHHPDNPPEKQSDHQTGHGGPVHDPSELTELTEPTAEYRGFINNNSLQPDQSAQSDQLGQSVQHGELFEPTVITARRKACPLHGHDDDSECFTCDSIRTELAS